MTAYVLVEETYRDPVDEISVIRLANGSTLGVNSWEVFGLRRGCDGYAAWKYLAANKVYS